VWGSTAVWGSTTNDSAERISISIYGEY
jgi:hypothetical protein